MDERSFEALTIRFREIAGQQPTRADLEAQSARLAEEAEAARRSFVGFVIVSAALVSTTLQENGIQGRPFVTVGEQPYVMGYVLRDKYAYGNPECPNEHLFGVRPDDREAQTSLPHNRKLVVLGSGRLAIIGRNGNQDFIVNSHPSPKHWYSPEAITSQSSGKALEAEAQKDMEAAVAHYSQGR